MKILNRKKIEVCGRNNFCSTAEELIAVNDDVECYFKIKITKKEFDKIVEIGYKRTFVKACNHMYNANIKEDFSNKRKIGVFINYSKEENRTEFFLDINENRDLILVNYLRINAFRKGLDNCLEVFETLFEFVYG